MARYSLFVLELPLNNNKPLYSMLPIQCLDVCSLVTSTVYSSTHIPAAKAGLHYMYMPRCLHVTSELQ